MSVRAFVFLGVGAVAVAGIVGTAVLASRPHGDSQYLEKAAAEAADESPRVLVDEMSFDVGTMDRPERFAHQFRLRNAGNAPLALIPSPSNCECLKIVGPSEPVPPGGEGAIDVQMNDRKGEVMKHGHFSRTIKVATNDPLHETLEFKLNGYVERPLVAVPAVLMCAINLADKDGSAEVHRRLSTSVLSETWESFALKVSKVSLPSAECSLEPIAPEGVEGVEAKAGYRLTVLLPSDLPAGPVSCTVDLVGTSPEADATPVDLQVEIQGHVHGRVALFGGKSDQWGLRLGTLTAGDSVREGCLVKVHDEKPYFQIERIETQPPFMRATLTPLKAGQSDQLAQVGLYRLEVEIPRDAPPCNHMGAHVGKIIIHTDHPKLPTIEFRVDFSILASDRGGAARAAVRTSP